MSFSQGSNAALDQAANLQQLPAFDVRKSRLKIVPTDKTGSDFPSRVICGGKQNLQFSGSKYDFLKMDAVAPKTLPGNTEFDDTVAGNSGDVPLQTRVPHVLDWLKGDSTWTDGLVNGLIGSANDLSRKGSNAFCPIKRSTNDSSSLHGDVCRNICGNNTPGE